MADKASAICLTTIMKLRRLRAILTGTTTATLGLLPLAVGGDTLLILMTRLLMFGLVVSMMIFISEQWQPHLNNLNHPLKELLPSREPFSASSLLFFV